MAINEQEIQEIVRSVLKGMGTSSCGTGSPEGSGEEASGYL